MTLLYALCGKNDVLINKISVRVTFIFQGNHFSKPKWRELPIYVRMSSVDFIAILERTCKNNEVDEIKIIIISYVKQITLSHYRDQPRSMLCRKLERKFIEEDFGAFDYNWLPNCFRHINT